MLVLTRHEFSRHSTVVENTAFRARPAMSLLKLCRRLLEQIFLTLDTSKIFAAHMFYSTDWAFWYVLGFDRRESASMRSKTLYLISDHFGLPIDEVWAQVVSSRADFPKLAITFKQSG
jgi:purine-nucleoside phosphorylase